MRRRASRPIALTVAGSDSGGGAGIQADLKAFAALGVHGTSVITCVTAQNPREVRAVQALPLDMVRAQLEAVCAELPPRAIKTGMLYKASIIREVARFPFPTSAPLVVDPVMVATSGARLLQPEAIHVLMQQLLPRATLVTPNLPEAEVLVGQPLQSIEDLRRAARHIWNQFGCAALIKGGHLSGLRRAVDILFDGRDEWLLEAPRIAHLHTHGTGCTYAAAIAAFLARGLPLCRAVTHAKTFISNAIAGSYLAAGHRILLPSG
ncbi:MAG: bifunctional hydroxymethylpyrimidine kinase/phosphomethylpyrimidine kinase [Verrucomicrobiota bacterium]|nr:bifunctional hydroxymethylpyrimidine kinase/phosphomethylpyrimidine kinase [Limisphaera sp.]MDW8381388.1 bifunctional hydroxymethylpyrimidine kinase/phosphomethylpyrimidine kinase [Verrucomicrobiota bacterium]